MAVGRQRLRWGIARIAIGWRSQSVSCCLARGSGPPVAFMVCRACPVYLYRHLAQPVDLSVRPAVSAAGLVVLAVPAVVAVVAQPDEQHAHLALAAVEPDVQPAVAAALAALRVELAAEPVAAAVAAVRVALLAELAAAQDVPVAEPAVVAVPDAPRVRPVVALVAPDAPHAVVAALDEQRVQPAAPALSRAVHDQQVVHGRPAGQLPLVVHYQPDVRVPLVVQLQQAVPFRRVARVQRVVHLQLAEHSLPAARHVPDVHPGL